MHNNDDQNNKFLPVAVIAAGLLIAGAVLWNGSHPTAGPVGGAVPPPGPGAPSAGTVDIKNVNTDGDPFIGQANAPLTIAFWSDFQCPYCKNFELGTLPQIITEYVNTGKVKIVFMDFAFLGNDSTSAALYSRSVWKLYPSQYFAWREAMYKAQDQEHQGFGNDESINKLNATIAGLDSAKIAADVKANMRAYQAMIDADKTEAGKAGVNATPSFVIGTQVIAGAYPYANFKTAIDEALK